MTIASESNLHIAIIGGGITGLSSAYYLQKAAETQSLPIHYTILESSPRLGGKIKTEMVHGADGQCFVVEDGPDCFLTQKPWALDLAIELGMEKRLLGTNDSQRKVYVLNKGKPTPLPDGVLLIVPTKFMPFALSPLISPLGKLRMGMDLFIAPKKDDQDETLAEFITRRLGNEALDKIAEPLMSGIYNAEADRQSVLATFPRFRDIEKKHGSLIKGMLASRNARATGASAQPAASTTNGRPKTVFATLRDGTEELPSELSRRLTGTIKLNARVHSIAAHQDGRYTLTVDTPDGSQEIFADSVLLTTPAYVTADILRSLAPAASDLLDKIRYVSTGTISLAYRSDDLQGAISGFGLVIPRSENRPINAITFSSTKFDHRAPEGQFLIRVFFGGSRSPQSMQLGDEELLDTVRQQIHELLGIDAEPLFHRIHRWDRADPQYDIGHLDRVDSIEHSLPTRIYVAGSPYRGVGIPDCVHHAQIVTDKMLDHARTHSQFDKVAGELV